MKKGTILLILIIIIGIGFLGFFAGKKIGQERTSEKLGAILDLAYPPPSQNLTRAGGIITKIYGNKITLEINDPEDYLPHPDGSPHKKITRIITLGNKTDITKVDYTKYQPDGSPTITELELNDLKKGETISIHTSKNLRTNKEVPVTKIEIVKY